MSSPGPHFRAKGYTDRKEAERVAILRVLAMTGRSKKMVKGGKERGKKYKPVIHVAEVTSRGFKKKA